MRKKQPNENKLRLRVVPTCGCDDLLQGRVHLCKVSSSLALHGESLSANGTPKTDKDKRKHTRVPNRVGIIRRAQTDHNQTLIPFVQHRQFIIHILIAMRTDKTTLLFFHPPISTLNPSFGVGDQKEKKEEKKH